MKVRNTYYSSFYTSFKQDVEEMGVEKLLSDCFVAMSDWALEVESEEDIRGKLLVILDWYKAVQASIISGKRLLCPQGLTTTTKSVLPDLLNPVLSLFFNKEGDPIDFTSSSEVDHLGSIFFLYRQWSLAFSKATDIPPDVDTHILQREFVDRMLYAPRTYFSPSDTTYRCDVVPIAHALLRVLFTDFNGRIHPSLEQFSSDPFGRHGPGAVTDGSTGRQKWSLIPSSRVGREFFLTASGTVQCPTENSLEETDMSRLTMVPKDLAKNRLICVEPKEMMFAQQGLRSVVEDIIKRSPFTRTAIQLDNQSYNFVLSKKDGYATIDLSDASDLLSLSTCRLLFPREVFKLVTRFRSSRIQLLDGEVLPAYRAMATMGNALCFPIESVAFWAISLGAILAEEIRLRTYRSTQEVLWVINHNPKPLIRRYRLGVFGDDIVVKDIYFDAVCEALEAAGLRVNHSKSCAHHTPIREACGSFWWAGTDIRVTRFRFALSPNTLSFISVAEQLCDLVGNGFNAVADKMFSLLTDVHPLPRSSLVSIQEGIKGGWIRYNESLQRLEARLPRLTQGRKFSKLDGQRGLYAHFTGQATLLSSRSSTQCAEWEWVPLSELNLI